MRWLTADELKALAQRTGNTFESACMTTDWSWIEIMFQLNDHVVLLKTDHGLLLATYGRFYGQQSVMVMHEAA